MTTVNENQRPTESPRMERASNKASIKSKTDISSSTGEFLLRSHLAHHWNSLMRTLNLGKFPTSTWKQRKRMCITKSACSARHVVMRETSAMHRHKFCRRMNVQDANQGLCSPQGDARWAGVASRRFVDLLHGFWQPLREMEGAECRCWLCCEG